MQQHVANQPAYSESAHPSADGRLNGVVIAFDLDNTLLDPDGCAYAATLAEFAGHVDLGLTRDEFIASYEDVRSYGNAFERLGLGNPIHDRAHPDALALLSLLYCRNLALRRDIVVADIDPDEARRFFSTVSALVTQSRTGSPAQKLATEISLRRYLQRGGAARRTVTSLRQSSGSDRLQGWLRAYRQIEEAQPVADHADLMARLASLGVLPVVITEGRCDIQLHKLKRIGLEHLAAKTLITESAARVPGIEELQARIDDGINAIMSEANPTPSAELQFLWQFLCAASDWNSKTPQFYGRCLHAIRVAPNAPASALENLETAGQNQWQKDALRFVMVGDRLDKDVAPVQELLGPGVGLSVRLRAGKYRDHQCDEIIAQSDVSVETFSEWAQIESFLCNDFSIGRVVPVTTSPAIVATGVVDRACVEKGLRSPFAAVRAVSEATRKVHENL